VRACSNAIALAGKTFATAAEPLWRKVLMPQEVQFGIERITIPNRIVFTRTGLAFAVLVVVPIQQRLDAPVGSEDATGS
jgi:hypothetical protein